MMKHLLLFCALLLLGLCAAQARPRDDAMAGLYRCNGLESDRQWLDCYYGAAQPARAVLGLAPALPDQIRLARTPPAGSASQPSEVRSHVIASAGNCYAEGSARGWLDCYYRAAQPMREQLGLAIAPSKVAPAPPAMTGFGETRPADPERQVTSRMATYSFDKHMIFTVVLANGQTWQQIEGDTDAARWKKPPVAYLATIRRGSFGSFILTVKGEPHSFRVRRIN